MAAGPNGIKLGVVRGQRHQSPQQAGVPEAAGERNAFLATQHIPARSALLARPERGGGNQRSALMS
jgi:hypothetical protein